MTFEALLGESAWMTKIPITAVVLSAGTGSRMASSLPKSLHPVAGRPILARILETLKKTEVSEIRVVLNEEHQNLIQPVTSAFKADLYFQSPKKGTAAAVQSANLDQAEGNILVVNGDHPLLRVVDLKNLIKEFQTQSADLCVGSAVKNPPGEYGRIVRQGDKVVAIVEKGSLTHESEKISEINSGIYLVKAEGLKKWLSQINNENSKKEYCLTDMVSIAASQEKKVIACRVSEDSATGVNTQRALAIATKKIFIRKLNLLMSQGVVIVDPLNTYIEESVQIGQGSVIYPGVYLKGNSSIGPFCALETNSFIRDSLIHEMVLIRAGSYLESAEVGANSIIGPYARLRPETKIGKRCKVGNFVEMKKTHFGTGSKASHHAYLGDTEVGENVNIGFGTVTCNLNVDGKKYQTTIGDKVFVGSGAQLVAPVKLGDGSVVGAGSVITRNVPMGALALERTPQKNVENYFKKENK